MAAMITLRRSEDRGHADHGWLDTRHTFSFADYRDAAHMGYRSLRVINEDRVQPGRGFGTHAHRDMEILTYVLEGAVAHRDSMGHGEVVRPGDVQRMTAGTGVTHSEVNPSPTEPLHLLQIWILPEAAGLEPGYEQRAFPAAEKRGVLRLVASRDGRDGSLVVHQDADVYVTVLAAGQRVAHRIASGRGVWVQVARGAVDLLGHELREGEGAAVEREARIELVARQPTELLLFDLA
jgi:redox-sensitive bicupin YhaK (pirin superfamily)